MPNYEPMQWTKNFWREWGIAIVTGGISVGALLGLFIFSLVALR